MKQKLSFLILSLAFCKIIFAQEFIGFVKKADSVSSPIFQAKVEISEGEKSFDTLKTYFDGSFKFAPNKSKTYTIKIFYAGYTDTSYTISVDKKGKLSAQNVVVKLKKDGMRLMGIIKSREEDFPIKDAVIAIRNIMTQQEDRIETDIDGKYNFKLEYETNYKVWIDKRSKGIFNVYKDTSFYISTVGFNMPLDYKLDIALDPIPFPSTTERKGYDPMKGKSEVGSRKSEVNTAKKVVEEKPTAEVKEKVIVEKKDTATILKAKTEKEKTVDKKIETKKDTIVISEEKLKAEEKKPVEVKTETPKKEIVEPTAKTEAKKEKKKKKQEPEVVVIRDDVRSAARDTVSKKIENTDELEAVRQKALAEQKQREAEKLAQQKFLEDSLLKVKLRNDSIAQATAKQKAIQDSVLRVKLNDSIALAKQIQKAKNDSLFRVKTERELKAKQDSIAQKKITTVTKPTVVDSVSQKKTIYHTKTQEELIAEAAAFAKRKKFLQDSIAKAKALDDSLRLREKK